tara:strand:- start:1363 stop:2181 length:819 start_codon:yes stop_codon:yes gene_type:complete
MPELPEVEVTRLGLTPLLNLKINQVIIRNYSLRWPILPNLKKILINQVLRKLSRRGKYILAELTSGTLIIHLGMSGRICITKKNEPPKKHDHVDIIFGDSEKVIMRYRDPRRFGSIHWTEKNPYEHKLIKKLGPEPLSDKFSVEYLYHKLKNKKQCIKNSIMDSHIVVGVGNIYASESLYYSGIKPNRGSNRVLKTEVSVLVKEIKRVISLAISKGGSTLNDFLDVNGENGYFQDEHKVYGRENEPCLKCKTPITQLKLGQRSSFFCKKCQT